jgi:hypothetical protein
MAGPFVRHMPGREPAQLVIDQRQQIRRGARVAELDRVEEAGDLVHEAKDTRRGGITRSGRAPFCGKSSRDVSRAAQGFPRG